MRKPELRGTLASEPADRRSAAPVDLASMRDARHDHHARVIVHGVDDTLIADPQTIVILAGELDDARGTRIGCEGVDGASDPRAKGIMETAIRPRRLPVQANLVGWPRRPTYSRTSCQ
jgi:hypothetical protein